MDMSTSWMASCGKCLYPLQIVLYYRLVSSREMSRGGDRNYLAGARHGTSIDLHMTMSFLVNGYLSISLQ